MNLQRRLNKMVKPVDGTEHPNPGEKPALQAFKDPVCGMDVSPQKSYRATHGDKEFRFCSLSCLEKFTAKPETFIKR